LSFVTPRSRTMGESMNLTDRYGRWAVVAGASTGLGAAIATEAARHCFDVVLLARREQLLVETARRLQADHGVATRTVVADLADPEIGTILADATAGLDVGVVIYNAAAEPEGPFLDIPLEEHRHSIEVNCWAPTVLAHHFGRQMAALQGIPMFASYGAAKAYELILGEGLWGEFRRQGVDVLSYVVGATASSNFIGLADGADDADATASRRVRRLRNPSTVDAVASRLFDVLGDGPRQYTHPLDEEIANAAAPRAEEVAEMGAITAGLARFQQRS